MGFGTAVNAMVAQSMTYATGFFSDFWPIVAIFVGLSALGYVVNLFMRG